MSGSPAALVGVLAPGGLTALFQPVFELGAEAPRAHYFEGLVRGPTGTNMESASTLFEYVRRKRQEAAVDGACATAILKAAAALPGAPGVSLNVHAVTLARDVDFPTRLAATAEENGIDPSRLVVEIVEHAPAWADPGLEPGLRLLRQRNVRLALDDVGFGNSNFEMMLDVRPDYFKLDRRLVHGCHADHYRRAVIESVVSLAGKVKARVIAEGVEVEEELEALRAMGLDLVQGWLFSPPRSACSLAARGSFSDGRSRPRRAEGALAPPRGE